jgi:hypothetical protein
VTASEIEYQRRVAKAAVRNSAMAALKPPATGESPRIISAIVPATVSKILSTGNWAAKTIALARIPATISAGYP